MFLYLIKCQWKAVQTGSSVTYANHVKLDQALASVSSYFLSLESFEKEEQHRNQFCERVLNTKMSEWEESQIGLSWKGPTRTSNPNLKWMAHVEIKSPTLALFVLCSHQLSSSQGEHCQWQKKAVKHPIIPWNARVFLFSVGSYIKGFFVSTV